MKCVSREKRCIFQVERCIFQLVRCIILIWRPPDISGGRQIEIYISPVEIHISSHDNIYLVLALMGFHNIVILVGKVTHYRHKL